MGIDTQVQVFSKYHFWFFSLTHKEQEVWQDGTHPKLFEESSCVCMPSFRPVDPFLFLAKVPFLAFYKKKYTERGVAL